MGRGFYRLFHRVGPCAVLLSTGKNAWPFTWGLVAAQAIGRGDRDYRLRGMYIEFENVPDPSDPVTLPTVDLRTGLDYYQSLSGSPTRDFVRVPFDLTPTIVPAPGYESLCPEGEGNSVIVHGQTQGNEGVFGKAFSAATYSKICGFAVIAAPDWADRARDLVFARAYFDPEQQLIRPETGELQIQHNLIFEEAA